MNFIILVMGIASNAAASLLIKLALEHGEIKSGQPMTAVTDLRLVSGVGLYGVAFLIYALALSRMPLIVVHPILTAGAIATVAVLAVVVLHEPLRPATVLGLLLVTSGVVVLAKG